MKEPTFSDLRSYLDFLRSQNDLVVVDTMVDPNLEVAEIHRRVIAAGGPALLFTQVRGSSYPLVTNLFGTAERATWAFGKRPMHLIERLVEVAQSMLPPTLSRLWSARDLGLEALKIGFKSRRSGPITEIVESPARLDRLPALTCWPEDGGPFVTLPLVFTDHPDGLGHNLGMYRLQIHDAQTTGMHWQIGKGGGFHYSLAESRGESLPVTVFLGGPPALILAAIAPLPENLPELLLASLLAGHRLDRCSGPGPHPLLARAEFALIGDVPPRVRRPEGPFGDHYGYYSLEHDYPVFNVRALAHRKDAIYPATVVGKPRQEDFFIGDLLQELLSPLFPLAMPGVKDLWSYGETGYHSLAAAVVQDRYRREAMASAFRILGEGQLSLTKFLFLTDSPIDLRDFPATLSHILARTNPETDLYILSNVSMDTLDYTGPAVNEGSKAVWLGLGDPVRELPRELPSGELPMGISALEVFTAGCLVVGGPSREQEPGFPGRIANHEAFRDWPLIVVTDECHRAAISSANFLWTTFTRFEPAADIYASKHEIHRNHLCFSSPIVFDARLTPDFPGELFAAPDTNDLVERRWREYFPGRDVEMGDSANAHLDPI